MAIDRRTRMSLIAVAVISVIVVAVVAVVIGRGDDHNGALPAASVLRAETPATVTVTPAPTR
ncbi:hypothetical protein MAHJHV45_47540 [Mycobacterium avium subsp. hominissuis]